MIRYIAPIVEGQTEVECIPALLYRIWQEELLCETPLRVLNPSRCDRSAVVQATHRELHNKVNEAATKLKYAMKPFDPAVCLILLLIDADKDDPGILEAELATRAHAARSDIQTACVMPTRELENWFKASASSLVGLCGLPDELAVPVDPEAGKGGTWLDERMREVNPRTKYKKTIHALDFARALDIPQTRTTSPSFERLCQALAAHAADS